jgi:hypothetical protein
MEIFPPMLRIMQMAIDGLSNDDHVEVLKTRFSNEIQSWTVPRHRKMALVKPVKHRLGRNCRGPWRVMSAPVQMQATFYMMEL